MSFIDLPESDHLKTQIIKRSANNRNNPENVGYFVCGWDIWSV